MLLGERIEKYKLPAFAGLIGRHVGCRRLNGYQHPVAPGKLHTQPAATGQQSYDICRHVLTKTSHHWVPTELVYGQANRRKRTS